MKKKLNCILLIDDDSSCNFFHERLLKKMDCVESIEVASNGKEGLDFLKSKKNRPDIIFLDINMPKMNGWEFLEEYEKLSEEEKSKIIVVMLTSSLNPDDRTKAENFGTVKAFNPKYLDKEAVEKLLQDYFSEYL